MFKSINPFTLQEIQQYEPLSEQALDHKLKQASTSFHNWRQTSFNTRAQLLEAAAHHLDVKQDVYAKIITSEMGKTIKEARAEIKKCADACRFYATHAEAFLKDKLIDTEASTSFVAFQPLGPVFAIMPWNFPFWQVFRFAAPALMAGNVGLLKHAGNVSGCSLAIENVFAEAGFPEGVFQSLLIDSKTAADVISDDRVAAVTLTGSEQAGSQVASTAGRAIKKTVLELGGSDAFVVLDDADLDLAAQVATQSRMQNAGQSCIAAKRFMVMERVKEEFLSKFKERIASIRQGDPTKEETSMGPMARLDLAEEVEKQISKSLSQGAALITGGSRDRCNFQPTLLDDVKPGMSVFDEEVFGPVAAVITVKTEEEAIATANNHRYGLGGSVWTRDKERGQRVARAIESGCVFVNSLMRSDQRLPFGGIKKSGYGRELSEVGIKEFVNQKTIYVA